MRLFSGSLPRIVLLALVFATAAPAQDVTPPRTPMSAEAEAARAEYLRGHYDLALTLLRPKPATRRHRTSWARRMTMQTACRAIRLRHGAGLNWRRRRAMVRR